MPEVPPRPPEPIRRCDPPEPKAKATPPDYSCHWKDTATGTEERVCNDIAERQRKGIAKYGTTVADNPLSRREWLQHAYEEAIDMAVYLKRLIELEDAIR